jgi:hypothetical protein
MTAKAKKLRALEARQMEEAQNTNEIWQSDAK